MKITTSDSQTQELFESRLSETYQNAIVFKVLHNSKLKMNPLGLCGKVQKTPELLQIATDSVIPNFVIVINQDVFDALDNDSQIIVIDKLIAQMGYDFDKDQAYLVKPDVQEYSGILKKYSYGSIEATKLAVQSIYQSRLEAEETKPKGKRGRKSKFTISLD